MTVETDKFLIGQSINVAGSAKKPSEDMVGWAPGPSPRAVWIFDGATSGKPSLIPTASSDPNWLVRETNEAMKTVWDDSKPTVEILTATQTLVAEAFRRDSIKLNPDSNEMPCAAVSIVRVLQTPTGAKLEVTNGGDCAVLMQDRTGAVSHLGSPYAAGQQLDAEIMKQVQTGKGREEIGRNVAQLNQDLRDLVNEPGGFPLIDPSERWIDTLHVNLYELRPGATLLLMTDGFERASKGLGLYSDKALIETAQQDGGLEKIVQQIRIAEIDPEKSKAYLKVHDDATAMTVQLRAVPTFPTL